MFFSDLEGIQGFTELRELILDGNEFDDEIIFPVLNYLNTLTMNKNKVSFNEKLLFLKDTQLPSLLPPPPSNLKYCLHLHRWNYPSQKSDP